MGAGLLFLVLLALSMPHSAIASDSKPAESGIAAVMQSPAVQQRFRHCAEGHSMPSKVRFTFMIGAGGEVRLTSVEPGVKKSIDRCFGNVADMLLLEPPGKPYKLVLTMSFPLPAEPPEESHAGPDPTGAVSWTFGSHIGVAGLTILAAGSALGMAGMILPYKARGRDETLEAGFFVSQFAFSLVINGSILSLIGTSNRAAAMRKQGIGSTPVGNILGWIFAVIGAPLMLTFSGLVYTYHSVDPYDIETLAEDEFPANETQKKYLAAWTAGGVLCILSFAAQAAHFAYQTKKMKKYGILARRGFPLAVYSPDPETGAHVIGLIWAL